MTDLADAARLLGPARMVLDRCAEGLPGAREEAAEMAQRIVDLIGHPATDEPPHVLVELDQLKRALVGHRVWIVLDVVPYEGSDLVGVYGSVQAAVRGLEAKYEGAGWGALVPDGDDFDISATTAEGYSREFRIERWEIQSA